MTKVKMSNQTEQGSSSDFIERRRSALERYLIRTAAHPVFSVDPDFREFLEAGKVFFFIYFLEISLFCK